MGKRVQKLALKNLANKVLNLGYVGENEHTQIVIDCSEVLWDYDEAVVSVVVQPPRGDMYPVEVTRKDDSIIWEITDSDLVYSGTGRVQITFTNDGEVVKSAIGNTKIDPSIMATGSAPTPLENWIDQAEETAHQIALTAKDEVIEQIQDAAEEARESIPADYTQLSDDVTGLKSAFAQLDANVITESAGPAPIVSIADGADGMPMRKVEVAIEPVQDLHGYDAPWPAGGGKNKLPPSTEASITSNGITAVTNDDESYTLSGTAMATATVVLRNFSLSAGEYLFSTSGSSITTQSPGSGTCSIYIRDTDNSSTLAQYSLSSMLESVSFTVSATTNVRIYMLVNTGWTISGKLYPMIRLATEADSTFAPYSNVCPISGWTGANMTRCGKNLWGGEAVKNALLTINGASIGSDADGGYVSFSATYTNNDQLFTSFKPDTQYTVVIRYKKSNTSLSNNLRIVYTDGTKKNIITADTYEEGKLYTAITTSQVGKTISHIEAYFSSGTALVYYDQCGLFEGVITKDQFESYQGQTYEVTFPAEAGTVYGGTLDVVSGKLVIDRAGALLNDPDKWVASTGATTTFNYTYSFADRKKDYGDSFGGLSCSYMVVGRASSVNTARWISATGTSLGLRWPDGTLDQVKADALEGKIEIVYKLASPIEITLTSTEIKTLLGINNVFADCGDTAITYPADTKMYIDSRINASRRLIAGIETGFVASKAYAVGDMLIIGDDLYKVASAIASGATITVGTNVTKTTVAEQLLALANA